MIWWQRFTANVRSRALEFRIPFTKQTLKTKIKLFALYGETKEIASIFDCLTHYAYVQWSLYAFSKAYKSHTLYHNCITPSVLDSPCATFWCHFLTLGWPWPWAISPVKQTFQATANKWQKVGCQNLRIWEHSHVPGSSIGRLKKHVHWKESKWVQCVSRELALKYCLCT